MRTFSLLSAICVLFMLVGKSPSAAQITDKVDDLIYTQLDWDATSNNVTLSSESEIVANDSDLAALEDRQVHSSSGVLTPTELRLFAKSLEYIVGSQCRQDLTVLLGSILAGQRWAIAMYDATVKSATGIQKSVFYQFGHFDECLEQHRYLSNDGLGANEVPVRAKYCLTQVQMDDFEVQPVAIRQKSMNQTSVVAYWGACVPVSCQSSDVELFLQHLLQRPVVLPDEHSQCQLNGANGQQMHVDAGMFVYAVVLLFFVLLAALSTAYHGYLIYVSQHADEVSKRALHHKTLTIALLSFSVIENTKKLFQASKDQLGLNSINGIKALAMLFILAGHALSFIYSSPGYNTEFIAEQTQQPTFAFLYNSLLFVDTFLLLSGFLFCRILLIELERRRGALNPLILYVGRYIRLTPAYMAVIGFYMTWFPRIGSGPLWQQRIIREQERCLDSWWLNILYVNNYFNTEKFCMFQSWYLSVDTQLFFVAPIFIYLLHKTRKWGKRLLVVVVIGTSTIPFVVTYAQKLDPTLLVYADELVDLANNNYYIGYYVKTHMRASAYFFGLLTGYLVHLMQEKSIKLPRLLVRLFWLLATVIGIAAMYSVCRFYIKPFNSTESVLYAGFHKVGWNLSVAWLVLAATTGHAGWLRHLLCSRLFVPISRLTYCAYLSNGLVELYHSSVLRSTRYFSYINLENDLLSHIIDTFILAFIICLLFESPIHALERILLRKAARSDQRAPSALGDNQTPSTSEEQVA